MFRQPENTAQWNNHDKFSILEWTYDLKGIFLSFCEYYDYSFKQQETLDKFCDFLLEVIHDGSVGMLSIPGGAILGQLSQYFPPYTGTPETFVAAFHSEYPTLEMCKEWFPENPEWYWEWEWWVWEYRTVEINILDLDMYL